MYNRYGNFNCEYSGDKAAANFFDSLPLNAKEEINRQAADIHSLDDLERFAAAVEGGEEEEEL